MSIDAPLAFEIRYCQLCGYRERAESLAAELRSRLGAEVLVAEGKLGQFDVIQEGEVVAGKGATFLRRMLIHGAPPEPELLATIERHLADEEGEACELPQA